jgi:hypothetical protein
MMVLTLDKSIGGANNFMRQTFFEKHKQQSTYRKLINFKKHIRFSQGNCKLYHQRLVLSSLVGVHPFNKGCGFDEEALPNEVHGWKWI